MKHNTRFVFNDVAGYDSPASSRGLIYAIRTDAQHATEFLQKNIFDYLRSDARNTETDAQLKKRIRGVVHGAYETWGHDIIRATSEHLDYSKYNIEKPHKQFLEVHFYRAHDLATEAVKKANTLIKENPAYDGKPVLYVSLDSMIEKHGEHEVQVAFSRLFSLNGTQQFGYVGRPGTKDLDDQIREVRDTLKKLKEQHGEPIPFILLEDNVRYAKTLNWIIEKMEQNGVFEHGELAGISTCFCCATPDQRSLIKQGGKTVPLVMAVDYKDAKVDVTTPRDLLFDGFVVQIGEEQGQNNPITNTSRLPGIFMNVAERFKIRPEKSEAFRDTVKRTNIEFCCNVQRELEINIPVSWFVGADAISHVSGHSADTPMAQVISDAKEYMPANSNIKQHQPLKAAP